MTLRILGNAKLPFEERARCENCGGIVVPMLGTGTGKLRQDDEGNWKFRDVTAPCRCSKCGECQQAPIDKIYHESEG